MSTAIKLAKHMNILYRRLRQAGASFFVKLMLDSAIEIKVHRWDRDRELVGVAMRFNIE